MWIDQPRARFVVEKLDANHISVLSKSDEVASLILKYSFVETRNLKHCTMIISTGWRDMRLHTFLISLCSLLGNSKVTGKAGSFTTREATRTMYNQ
jgi:predicted transposase YbfD/YdcC